MKIGVPQGSIEPFPFLTYINDLHIVKETAQIILFADDTSLEWESTSRSPGTYTTKVVELKY